MWALSFLQKLCCVWPPVIYQTGVPSGSRPYLTPSATPIPEQMQRINLWHFMQTYLITNFKTELSNLLLISPRTNNYHQITYFTLFTLFPFWRGVLCHSKSLADLWQRSFDQHQLSERKRNRNHPGAKKFSSSFWFLGTKSLVPRAWFLNPLK